VENGFKNKVLALKIDGICKTDFARHKRYKGYKLKPPVQGADRTEFARSQGYRGNQPVIVLHGRVISHHGMLWSRFLAKIRMGRL